MKQILVHLFFIFSLSLISRFSSPVFAASNCCPAGSALNSSCTTAAGDFGNCAASPHSEPYLTQCANANPSLLACIGSIPNTGCCQVSQAGQQCTMGNGDIGTCRAPSGAMESALCLPNFYYCGAQTSSGSFMCSCTKTAYGYNCGVGMSSCQGGLQPDTNICSHTATTNPCGGNASITNCQLPCVPGGNMKWGDYGCVPFDPNVINDPAKICSAGLVCNAGFCMKPDGSANFSEACIWTSECGTCKTGNGTPYPMTCDKISGQTIGMCNGVCGGGVSAFQGNDAAFCDPGYTLVNTAVGCVPINKMALMVTSLLNLGTSVSAGIAFILIIIAGFQFATSSGDPKRAAAAKQLITSALTGLIFIVLSVLILNFLGVSILNLSGLGFHG